MIAALYVNSKGPYSTVPYVDLWDQERDARLYAGPYPVDANCSRIESVLRRHYPFGTFF